METIELQKKREDRQSLILGCGLLVLLMTGLAAIGYLALRDLFGAVAARRANRAFRASIPRYLSLYHRPGGTEHPFLRPPVLPIDVGTKRIDRTLYTALGRARRAQDPSQVRTVVFLSCEPVLIGHYSDGSKGFANRCELSAVDLQEGTTVANGVLTENPPSVITHPGRGRDVFAARPNLAMSRWLIDRTNVVKR